MVQDELGLPVEDAGPAGLIAALGVKKGLESGVGDGRTDGVGVRMAVADDLDRVGVLSGSLVHGRCLFPLFSVRTEE